LVTIYYAFNDKNSATSISIYYVIDSFSFLSVV
jgi:hypothetical protein